jgi:rubrerythrin
MAAKCVHSCKGLCNALVVAEQHEQQAIAEYREYAAQCDYPEVRNILETMAGERQRMLRFLREQRSVLEAKFATMDGINDSFA